MAVILASNVGLTCSGCWATAGVPSLLLLLMVEKLFFAHGVFVGRFLLFTQRSRCLAILFTGHCCVSTGGFYLVYTLEFQD